MRNIGFFLAIILLFHNPTYGNNAYYYAKFMTKLKSGRIDLDEKSSLKNIAKDNVVTEDMFNKNSDLVLNSSEFQEYLQKILQVQNAKILKVKSGEDSQSTDPTSTPEKPNLYKASTAFPVLVQPAPTMTGLSNSTPPKTILSLWSVNLLCP